MQQWVLESRKKPLRQRQYLCQFTNLSISEFIQKTCLKKKTHKKTLPKNKTNSSVHKQNTEDWAKCCFMLELLTSHKYKVDDEIIQTDAGLHFISHTMGLHGAIIVLWESCFKDRKTKSLSLAKNNHYNQRSRQKTSMREEDDDKEKTPPQLTRELFSTSIYFIIFCFRESFEKQWHSERQLCWG